MLRNKEGKTAKDYAYEKMDSKLVALLDTENDKIMLWWMLILMILLYIVWWIDGSNQPSTKTGHKYWLSNQSIMIGYIWDYRYLQYNHGR